MLAYIFMWILLGGAVGWLVGPLLKPDGRPDIFSNVVVGTVGAAIATSVISPLIGWPDIKQSNLDIPSVLVALGGAVILLALVNLLRRLTMDRPAGSQHLSH